MPSLLRIVILCLAKIIHEFEYGLNNETRDSSLIDIYLFLLQLRNKMVLRYARTAWGRARARLRLSGPSPNSQLLVDSSSHGSGNGKRNQKSSKLLLEVSTPTICYLNTRGDKRSS